MRRNSSGGVPSRVTKLWTGSGSIDVESVLGKGSTFTIRLSRVRKEPWRDARGSRASQKVEPGLVLLTEDDQQVRRVATRALEGHGFQVLEARSGAEALELAEQNVGRLSCVLTDLVMPLMGGDEFLRQLPDRPAGPGDHHVRLHRRR